MIDLRLLRNTIADDLDNLINKIANPGGRQARSVADAIRQGFQDNFTSEGGASGNQWAQLAPRTVLQRQKLGFAGQHPILVRTGRYRDSFVRRGAADNYENIQRSTNGLTIDAGTTSPRANVHEFGATVSIPSLQEARGGGSMHVGGARSVHIPARPVTELGAGSEQRIMTVIDFMISQIEADVIGKR